MTDWFDVAYGVPTVDVWVANEMFISVVPGTRSMMIGLEKKSCCCLLRKKRTRCRLTDSFHVVRAACIVTRLMTGGLLTCLNSTVRERAFRSERKRLVCTQDCCWRREQREM